MPESSDLLLKDFTKSGLSENEIRRSLAPVLLTTQGHILGKHGRDSVRLLFLRFNDRRAALALSGLTKYIPNVAELDEEDRAEEADSSKKAPVCFLGLSWPGIQKLQLDLSFAPAFKHGFRKRANDFLMMGDAEWDSDWTADPFDAILICAATNCDSLNTFHETIRRHFERDSYISVAMTEDATIQRKQVPNGKGPMTIPFGFVDGVSQPVFFPWSKASRPVSAKPNSGAALREVIVPDRLCPPNTVGFGSFLACLRIEQHEDRFEAAVSALAKTVTVPAGSTLSARDYAASLMMGRTPDGDPLVGGKGGPNDFDRSLDPNGDRWPWDSHTSRMNPRGGLIRRSIVRRGISFEREAKKGLLFQSFQADLENQFEELLARWANNPNHPKEGTAPDPIMGRCPHAQAIQPGPCLSKLTTIRGGEYFYFPSIPAIQMLVSAQT